MIKLTAKGRQWALTGLIVLAAAGLFFANYYRSQKWKKDHMLLELRAIQVPKGWGYDIFAGGKKFIHQPFIPAIPGDYAFKTREDALAVGQKVYDRILAGQVPMVTAAEVRQMGLDPNPSSPAGTGQPAGAVDSTTRQTASSKQKDSSGHK